MSAPEGAIAAQAAPSAHVYGVARGGALLALILALLAGLMVAGCSRGKKSSSQGLSKRVVALGQPVPKGGGRYKVGNPYKIGGRWYRPQEQPNYDNVGVASWYGELFHGRYTANGEIYDMNALTAAHPTLPMPSYVQVTNLRNGRTLVLRVNDRGPYAHDRIIDLSRRSARALGFERNGTVKVRVKYLGDAPLNGDDSYERQFHASQSWARYASLGGPARPMSKKFQVARVRPTEVKADPMVVGSLPDGTEANTASWNTKIAKTVKPSPRGAHQMYFVQASSFKSKSAADDVNRRLSEIGQSRIVPVGEGQETRYRVRLGPYAWRHDADQTLREVVSIGFRDAYLVRQ